MDPTPPAPLTTGALAVTALLGGSGTLHLVRPQVFEGIVPRPLQPWRRGLVVASGVAELGCAAGLLHPRSRRGAGPATAALLVAVWPANVQMSLSLGRAARRRRDLRSRAAWAGSLVRLPLQWPMVRAAWRAGR